MCDDKASERLADRLLDLWQKNLAAWARDSKLHQGVDENETSQPTKDGDARDGKTHRHDP